MRLSPSRTWLAVAVICVATSGAVGLKVFFQKTVPVVDEHWHTFTSRGGWSIRYPPSWNIASCRNCSDPAEVDMFVLFEDPKELDSVIMVYPLADRMVGQSDAAWFDRAKHDANQNQIIEEMTTKVDGRPALRVVYRHADGTDGEDTYVLNGTKGFQIGGPGRSQTKAYPIFAAMVSSFHLTSGEAK